ncbi:Fungal transcriptional regulatory protein, N-terminal [Penicillium camemberti]|uniref:Fungal transcriptional regulatory protein, N-terminal n=1 Tax=Penicillium camemberti (strain FM 013) TaxID=1429867 RepID=A0A0G4PJH1_PENC3|nr:Fungal transcriptional regulatory protein, N-terminal [Penicillium camemberti]
MSTTSGSVNQTSDRSAPRTCIPCKSSKKKCDKNLPTCDRCSRLDLPCTYDEAAETVQDSSHSTAKSQTILDRLERLESRVFASEEPWATVTPDLRANSNIEVKEAQENAWQLRPSLLQPSYLEFIVGMNLTSILEEKSTSIRAVGEKYFDSIHDFLPIISKERIDKRTQEAESLQPNGGFMILILSILLLTEEPVNGFVASGTFSSPELYRVCKYHYSLFSSLKEPCVELIQSGLLIALYEHAHCLGSSQAYLTIGTCARMAGAIGLPTPTSVGKIGTLQCEADACDVLERVQAFLCDHSPAYWSACPGSTRLIRDISLEAELQRLMTNFTDHRDDFLWHRGLDTTFGAMLCAYAFYQIQTTSDSAVEFPGQLQATLESMMDISSSRLNLLTMTGDVHLAFLSPFSITGILLVLEAIGLLDPVENIDTYLLRYRQTFMDVLRRLSSRWRLADLRKAHEAHSPTQPNPQMGWYLCPTLGPTGRLWARGESLLGFE